MLRVRSGDGGVPVSERVADPVRRPPFRRRQTRRSARETARGNAPATPLGRLKPLRNVLLILVALSLFQYVTGGEVTWHRVVLDKLGDMVGVGASDPRSGWGKTVEKVEELGARREGRPIPDFDLSGRITGVLDGDSIVLLDEAGEEHTVRLFGIDAPERGQPHADVARQFLADKLARRSVGVVVQGRDRYGRSTGTVYLEESNINLLMVRQGHAWWYRQYASHDHLLEEAERAAREQRAGLWSETSPVPPWEWRRVKPGRG